MSLDRNRLRRILASEGFKNAAPDYKPDVRAYLKDPGGCPYCGSTNLGSDAFDTDDDVAWRPVECDNCEAKWGEVYKINGFEPDRGPRVDVEDLAEAPMKNSPMGKARGKSAGRNMPALSYPSVPQSGTANHNTKPPPTRAIRRRP
jgi:hypothetical protein